MSGIGGVELEAVVKGTVDTIFRVDGKENLEVLKCKRDYPFKSPILELHRDIGWKDNFYLQTEKLDDGVCFYYR